MVSKSGITIKIKGAEDLVAALNQLGKGVRNNLIRRGLRKAGKPLVAYARARAPVETGTLKRSLGASASSKKGGALLYLKIGVKRGYERTVVRPGASGPSRAVPAHYIHLVERGNSRIRPQPFMRPTFDYGRTTAPPMFQAYLRAELPKLLAKVRSKGGK